MAMKNTKYERLYMRMCSCCPNAKKCHEECITCEDFDEALNRKPLTRRFKQLNNQEICRIYNLYKSGMFTKKEIREEFNISDYTLERAVDEIEYFLRNGTPKSL